MKATKIASALFLTLGMVTGAAQAADQGSGRVIFTGSIIDAPCSVNPDHKEQEVDLGQIASVQLENNGVSTPRNFQIELENCALNTSEDDDGNVITTAPSVSVKFGGSPAVPDDKTWFGITGTASGAGVVITDGSGTKIPVNGSTVARDLIEGNNTLAFSAYLQGLGGTITTGEFQSIADFTLSYE